MGTRRILCLLVLISILLPAAPGYSQSPAQDAAGETLAGITYGDDMLKVVSVLGEPGKRSRSLRPMYDNLYHDYFSYPSKGIEVEFAEKKAIRIELTAPGMGTTARGVRIGDPESMVRKHYIIRDGLGREVRKLRAGELVFCGDPYRGLAFVFDGRGRLKKIGLGKFSE